MTLRDAHDPYIKCDGCFVVASPGPISRGGFTPEWMRPGKIWIPPGWTLKASVIEPLWRHYCVRCIRKGKAR